MARKFDQISRRDLLKLFGISVGASIASPGLRPLNARAQSRKVTPRGGARNVIYIEMCGSLSPHETFDLWENKYLAKDLDFRKVNSDFMFSKTLFPNYERWAHKASIVRSMYENSLVHAIS